MIWIFEGLNLRFGLASVRVCIFSRWQACGGLPGAEFSARAVEVRVVAETARYSLGGDQQAVSGHGGCLQRPGLGVGAEDSSQEDDSGDQQEGRRGMRGCGLGDGVRN